MHPESRPHRLLGMSLAPLPALELDRSVLGAARKHRAFEIGRESQSDPGPWGIGLVLRLLARLYVRG
jgi:hypothetical protein